MPSGLRRRAYGRGHGYTIDGEKVDGVTTLIGGGIPKPALTTWAARSVAEYVADNLTAVWGMREMGREAIVAALKETPWAAARAGAAKGTEVHKLADPLSRGEEVDLPEHLAGYVEACVAFLDQWKVRPLAVECPVGSRRWRYAGTPDAFVEVLTPREMRAEFLPEPIPAGTNLRAVLDWKTAASGIWAEAAYQEAAYRHAEIYNDEHGDERNLADLNLGDVGLGVWLRADGHDVYPIDVSERVFKDFLHAAWVGRMTKTNRSLIGEAV